LDGDTVWFGNPYPIFKTLYKEHQLIFQTDNPFANAGVFYVQNVQSSDAAAWVLQELNRRIARFTYHPESVKQLPSSGWTAAPFFANADEQANLNDVLASALSGELTFGSGVEFMEARFKERFAPGRCNRPRLSHDPECQSVQEARKRMHDHSWTRRVNEGGAVSASRRSLRSRSADRDSRHAPLTHLCQGSSVMPAHEATLRVPGNKSAPTARVAFGQQWLFSHFPYGSFFESFRRCHASSWDWKRASSLELRLCMPGHRVPSIMVHMAGLRQESWGRRTLMRALGVWQDSADAVAPEAWVSARAPLQTSTGDPADAAAPATADSPAGRVAAWTSAGRLLVTSGVAPPTSFSRMAEYDRFAARLILLGLLLRRRAVMPPIDCRLPYMRKALEARHLRGMEVGCGPLRQCVWLPYPHHIEPWCAGIDFLWDADYRLMQTAGEVPTSDVTSLPASALRLTEPFLGVGPARFNASGVLTARDPAERVLVLHAGRDSAHLAGKTGKEPLGWINLGGFRTLDWKAPLPRRIEAVLRAQAFRGGLGLSNSQVAIVKTCLKSLATSKE
jgi:hypothetical protein